MQGHRLLQNSIRPLAPPSQHAAFHVYNHSLELSISTHDTIACTLRLILCTLLHHPLCLPAASYGRAISSQDGVQGLRVVADNDVDLHLLEVVPPARRM
jgi:hypothetical protein